MANGKPTEELLYDLEKSRLWYTFWITIIGLAVAAGVIFIILPVKDINAEGIAAVVGLFTSVLGTIVGAFLGLQIGLGGKAEADAGRLHAQSVALEAIEKLRSTNSEAAEQLSRRLR